MNGAKTYKKQGPNYAQLINKVNNNTGQKFANEDKLFLNTTRKLQLNMVFFVEECRKISLWELTNVEMRFCL